MQIAPTDKVTLLSNGIPLTALRHMSNFSRLASNCTDATKLLICKILPRSRQSKYSPFSWTKSEHNVTNIKTCLL